MKSPLTLPKESSNLEMLSYVQADMQYYLQDGLITLILSVWKRVIRKLDQIRELFHIHIGQVFQAAVSNL
jgi:hypothetical protein